MGQEKKLIRSVLVAFTVETLSVTWCLKIPGWAPLFSILYFVSGMAIALLLLFLPAIRFPSPRRAAWKAPINFHRLIITGLIALIMYSWSRYWFDELPIDIANADMLPIIKVMGERFLVGQHSQVYDKIPWIWKGVQPIYLPAMWLPYVPAIALDIDMRWITVAGLLFAFGTFAFLYRLPAMKVDDQPAGPQLPTPSFFLGVLAFLLFWWIVADNTAGIVSVAEEGVVIGYYVLLVLALVSGKPWLTGIALSLCMLSRYSLIGWIPAYLFILVLERKWRQLSIITLTGMGCFVLLFLVPVGWETFIRLTRLPEGYISFAARVWKDSPDVFSSAPGFAWFFGRKRIALLHNCLVTLSFVTPLLFSIIAYSRSRSGRWPIANIPLATLKAQPGHLLLFYRRPLPVSFFTPLHS